jgi:serine/threonine protein kinase
MLKHQVHCEKEAKKGRSISQEHILVDMHLEEKLAATTYNIHLCNAECDELKQELDNAMRQVDELRDQNRHIILEFSIQDLEQATENFSDMCNVGDNEYGGVYKGNVHKTMVAIKLSCSQSLFQQEVGLVSVLVIFMIPFSNAWLLQVSILQKCRHPNIVTIIGICSEASALVYEWLPNGNLEDCIVSSNNSPPPLPWCKRTQIIGDVCCTLLFLHANKPSALVHGDLRPCNILIDANYRSKLCNFGLSNLFLAPGAFPPNLNVRLPYIDPEFLTTGELTPQSDIYSLGVIILRLLTGMSPFSIAKKVASALESDTLHLMIDKSAGNWPYTQAKQLAFLGLSCMEMTREKRPDLLTDVWKVIEPMVTRPLVAYFQSVFEGSSAPAHFFCPIRMVINSDNTSLDGLGPKSGY